MTKRAQRTQYRQDRVRDDIIDVTRKLVLESGIADLTLAQIARELELTKPALYHYFPSKDMLLFELVFSVMAAEIDAIEAAIERTDSGAAAVEALIRSFATHYQDRMPEFRLVYLTGQVGTALRVSPESLERIRPFNDRVYGRAAQLIARDKAEGRVAHDVVPRRAAFLAHCAIIGVFTFEGLVAAGDEAPLIHAHEDLIDDLVRTHTARLVLA